MESDDVRRSVLIDDKQYGKRHHTIMDNEATKEISTTVFPKICSIIILPLASTFAGMLPLILGNRFHKQESNKPTIFDKVMSYCLYFGGGVLLCTIFLHLLPEMHEDVEELEGRGINLNKYTILSFPELLVCSGFFLIFFIEQVMHMFFIEPGCRKPYVADKCGVFMVERAETFAKIRDDDENISGTEQEHINNLFDGSKNYHSCTERPCLAADHPVKMHHQCHLPDVSPTSSHDHVDHSHMPNANAPLIYGLLTVIALSTHELFEGLAVGLAPKESDVWYLLTAISCHKVVLAAFIGVRLLVTGVKRSAAYIYVVGFALTSPVGIAIGLLMTTRATLSATLSIVSITLQAIATGTLMYIVFFEVYAKQFGSYKVPGILKLASSVAGFIFMAFLQIKLDS